MTIMWTTYENNVATMWKYCTMWTGTQCEFNVNAIWKQCDHNVKIMWTQCEQLNVTTMSK